MRYIHLRTELHPLLHSSIVADMSRSTVVPVLLLAPLPFLLFLLLPALFAQTLPQPNITSISGCTDVGNTTWNCTAGSELTVRGQNFREDVWSVSSSDVLLDCIINEPIDVVNSSLTCWLRSNRPPTWPGNVLEASVLSFRTGPSTPVFYGFAMSHVYMPVLTGIYGCNDTANNDGTWTRDCQPDSAQLTIVGAHFSVFDTLPYGQVHLLLADSALPTIFINVLNDSALVVDLGEFYARTFVPDHYASQALKVAFQVSWYYTNAVYLSLLAPIPPPAIGSFASATSPADGGCQGPNPSGPGLVGCVPGISHIGIYGHFFYQPMRVLVGGYPCQILYMDSTQMQVVLPLIPNYVPGFSYDLVLNDSVYWDDDEVGIYPQAFAFEGGAIPTHVLPCIPSCSLQGSGAKCRSGDVLTVKGVGFTSDPAAFMTLSNGQGWSANCTTLVEVDADTYACTLPESPGYQPQRMTITLTTMGVTSTPLPVIPYDLDEPLYITGVEGCGQQVLGGSTFSSNYTISLTGCSPGDDLILIGSGFRELPPYGEQPTILTHDNEAVELQMLILSLNYTALHVHLPGGYFKYITYGRPYAFSVILSVLGCSNPVTITYVDYNASAIFPTSSSSSSSSSTGGLPTPPPATSSSSSGLSAGGIAGVVIAVVVVAALVLAVLLMKGGRWGKRSGGEESGLSGLSPQSRYAAHQDSDFELHPARQ